MLKAVGDGRQGIASYGLVTPTSNGILTNFSFPHNLPTPPQAIFLSPRNFISAGNMMAVADATNITITYIVAPVAGTLSIYWMAL